MRTAMRVFTGVDAALDVVRAALVDAMGLRRDGGDTLERRLLDSFDWRVWDAGAVLQHDTGSTGSWLTWRRRVAAGRAEVLAYQPAPTAPVMATDLAAGPVTRLLAPALEMRALLPRAVLRVAQERFSVRDDEDKTVARALIEQVVVTGPDDPAAEDLGWRVVVTDVRGYSDAFDGLVRLLVDVPGVAAADDDVDRVVFEAAGAQPGDYSSKLQVAIEPQLSSLQALTAICTALLDAIEVNEPGVREGVDTEFLHDFRVAIRRTRALVAQARGVLPDDERDRYGAAFKWLAGETSELRDLDVYLLGFDDLAAQLPAEQRADIEPFRDLLVDLRRDAHERLVAALDSHRYRELIDAWRAFLDAPEGGEAAAVPVGRTAGERIWRAYRGVVRHGRRIDDTAPAEDLHDLRKRAKKLRYLLEAYRSLYPRRAMKALVAELKALQDNLGAFQDRDVQISSLRRFAELLDQRPGPTAEAVLAMGLLTDRLLRRQEEARAEFHARFRRFDRRKNRDRFRRLFEPVAEPVS